MTPDTTIPAPPPGWAIVPEADTRLLCLPVRPMVYCPDDDNPKWEKSIYESEDQVQAHDRRNGVYALPIEPALPWSLPAPPAGQAWHRQDGWTAEMLPEGWRPLLLGELPQKGDELLGPSRLWKEQNLEQLKIIAGSGAYHQRTRRPLPASQPEQASPAEDEVVTWAHQAAAENRQACNRLTAEERQNLLGIAKAIISTDPKGEAGKAKAPLARQEGGSHYKDCAIQPVEFIHANSLGFLEGCVIKRICRHRKKNKAEDLRKAIHELELLIALEYPDA